MGQRSGPSFLQKESVDVTFQEQTAVLTAGLKSDR